jgi:hypothetical protein
MYLPAPCQLQKVKKSQPACTVSRRDCQRSLQCQTVSLFRQMRRKRILVRQKMRGPKRLQLQSQWSVVSRHFCSLLSIVSFIRRSKTDHEPRQKMRGPKSKILSVSHFKRSQKSQPASISTVDQGHCVKASVTAVSTCTGHCQRLSATFAQRSLTFDSSKKLRKK